MSNVISKDKYVDAAILLLAKVFEKPEFESYRNYVAELLRNFPTFTNQVCKYYLQQKVTRSDQRLTAANETFDLYKCCRILESVTAVIKKPTISILF